MRMNEERQIRPLDRILSWYPGKLVKKMCYRAMMRIMSFRRSLLAMKWLQTMPVEVQDWLLERVIRDDADLSELIQSEEFRHYLDSLRRKP